MSYVYKHLGTLFKTRCTRCGNVTENHDIPIVPSLEGKGYVWMFTLDDVIMMSFFNPSEHLILT